MYLFKKLGVPHASSVRYLRMYLSRIASVARFHIDKVGAINEYMSGCADAQNGLQTLCTREARVCRMCAPVASPFASGRKHGVRAQIAAFCYGSWGGCQLDGRRNR